MKFRFLTSSLIITLPFVSCGDKEAIVTSTTEVSDHQPSTFDLLSAIKKGDLHTVKDILKKGVDVHSKNSEGYTALHLAATSKNQDLVSLLIGAGADIDSISTDQNTPLMLAVKEGDSKMVEYLLEHGAQTGLKDSKNRSALILAIDENNIESVSQLAPYSNIELDTALLYAASQGKYQVIETLTDEGASIYVRHEGGMTPLMLAAQNGHTATVYTLIESGANRYAVNEHGWTASQVAESAGQELIAKFLNEEPNDDDFAITEADEDDGVDWPQPAVAFYEDEDTSSETTDEDSSEHSSPKNTSPDTNEDTRAAAVAKVAGSAKAATTTVKLPFISGKTVAITSDTTAKIATDLKMLDYKEKPLPLIVEKTTSKNQSKHAEIRMLYGTQKTVSVKEGSTIPNTRFKITSIRRKFHDSKITDGQPADISVVEIEDTNTGQRRQMTTRIPASASEPWAVLRSQSSGETYAVRAGQKFQTSSGQPFTVTDVRPNQLVIVHDDTGEAMTIPLGR